MGKATLVKNWLLDDGRAHYRVTFSIPPEDVQRVEPPVIHVSPFDTAFEEQIAADFTLICGREGREIKASRFILMIRSNVFKTMILADREEKKSSRVVIPDIEFEPMQGLVKFFYNEKIDLKDVANSGLRCRRQIRCIKLEIDV